MTTHFTEIIQSLSFQLTTVFFGCALYFVAIHHTHHRPSFGTVHLQIAPIKRHTTSNVLATL